LGKCVANASAQSVDQVFFGMAIGWEVDPLAAAALAAVRLAVKRLDLGANPGLVRPSLRRPLRDAASAGPLRARFALCQRECELALEALSLLSGQKVLQGERDVIG
jgi:hypothetical protein